MSRVLLAFSFALFLIPVNALAAEPQEWQADLLVVGATESGWAAAMQAARQGVPRIVVVHDGVWWGGQYTEQALCCVDENKGVSKIGFGPEWHRSRMSFQRSGLFKELIDGIEAHNRAKYGYEMPGNSWHGPTTFHPAEAEAVFRRMIEPYIDSGQVRVAWEYYPVKAQLSADRNTLEGLTFHSLIDKPDLKVTARMTIDASDWGDAIQVAGAEFEVGPDGRAKYGESSAPEDLSNYPPNELNPITWCMVIEEGTAETPIPRPQHYDERSYYRVSKLTLPNLGKLKWDRKVRNRGSINHWPDEGKVTRNQLSVYTVRRIVDGYKHASGEPTAILLCYTNGQDYPLERLPQHVVDALEATEKGASQKSLVLMNREQRQLVFDDCKQHALGVLYTLQTLVHDRAEDKTHTLRKFHLSDEFGTPDQLPIKPYIRESLRLQAQYMMRQEDSRNQDGPTKDKAKESYAAAMYYDGIFCWQFHYDFHRTGRTYLTAEGATGPWIDYEKTGRNTRVVSDRSLFPLRSLVPVRMQGLLGAQKNLGYSSVVSAAIRLHDQCVTAGQASGAIAALCLDRNISAHDIARDFSLLEEVRHSLCGKLEGVQPLLLWPFRDLQASDPNYVAINRLAARRAFPLGRRDVDFLSDEPADPKWRTEVARRSLLTKQADNPPQVPDGTMTRGEFATAWWKAIQDLPDIKFPTPSKVGDADADGIADVDDARPFDADNDDLPSWLDEDDHRPGSAWEPPAKQ